MKINMMELSKFVKWSVAGDGCVSFATHNKDAHYSITRSIEHEDYINRIAEKINDYCKFTISKYDRKDNGRPVLSLRTSSAPLFTRVRERQYIYNHRVIEPHMLSMLDAEALAFLYQDDGSMCFNTKGYRIVRISTCAYSFPEQEALRTALMERLGLCFNINRTGKNLYQLNLATKHQNKFFDMIGGYVVPSYYYKLPVSSQKETSQAEDDLV